MPTYPTEQAAKILAEGLPIGPRMYPCVCGAPRAIHGGTAGKGRCAETGCKRYRADLAYELVYRALDARAESLNSAMKRAEARERATHLAAHPKEPGQWSIGASDAGTCRALIGYREDPPEGYTPLPEDKRAARIGTIIHAEVTRRLAILYPWRIFEHRVHIDGLDRDSRLDNYDPVTGEVEDLKTAGQWRWEQLGENGPDEDTWDQVMLYGLGMEDEGYTVRTVRLTYIGRDHGHDDTFVRPFDRARAETVRQRLLGIATALDLGMPLPRDRSGPTTDALCKRCPARVDCWNLDAAVEAGRSGESYTILGAEPPDESVIWAAEQLIDARALRLAAKNHEDESAALLDGVEPGEYGPVRGYEQRFGTGPNHKATAAKLRELLDLPDGQRPAAADVPTEQYPGVPKVVWKRQRAATRQRKARDAKVPTDAGAA